MHELSSSFVLDRMLAHGLMVNLKVNQEAISQEGQVEIQTGVCLQPPVHELSLGSVLDRMLLTAQGIVLELEWFI